MRNCFLGIDPGVVGFVTAIFHDGSVKFAPIADLDALELNEWLGAIKTMAGGNIVAVMEEVHAIFGSSAKSTFSFGEINGLLLGLLIANKIPYSLVPPKTWQKEIWENHDVVATFKTVKRKNGEVRVKDVNTKATSTNAARRLFPDIDLRKNERCKKVDDNKVDSLLIAEYARRKNL